MLTIMFMGTILLIATTGMFNLLSFYLGAKIVQKTQNNEEIDMLPSPVRMIEEHKIKEKDKEESKINEINMENINNYDGTSNGQKNIP